MERGEGSIPGHVIDEIVAERVAAGFTSAEVAGYLTREFALPLPEIQAAIARHKAKHGPIVNRFRGTRPMIAAAICACLARNPHLSTLPLC